MGINLSYNSKGGSGKSGNSRKQEAKVAGGKGHGRPGAMGVSANPSNDKGKGKGKDKNKARGVLGEGSSSSSSSGANQLTFMG